MRDYTFASNGFNAQTGISCAIWRDAGREVTSLAAGNYDAIGKR